MVMSISALSSVADAMSKKTIGTFTNNNMSGMYGSGSSPNTGKIILFYLIFFLLLYLTMMIGAFIFNVSVIKVFPSIKKISTLDFFGLYIVLHMLFC